MSSVTNRDTKGQDADNLSGGFITSRGDANLVVQVPRTDELLGADPDTDLDAVRHKRKARSIKLAVMGLSSAIVDKADPRYKQAIKLANTYRRKRCAELAEMHGGVSIGASALLASGALALAASRYLYEKYAEDNGGALGVGMLKQAAQLADSARSSELAAWEMSARENLARRKLAAADQGVPWLAQVDGDGKKPGRKTNKQRIEALNERLVITPDGTEVLLDHDQASRD